MKNKKLLNENFVFSISSIVLGLLVGAIVLLISQNNPFTVYGALIEGVIAKPKYIGWTVIRATPLILTGLSIAFAFKTGLFNIGAEGQFIIGALVATIVGAGFDLPLILHIPLTLILAALGGAAWGGIVGWLKARFGINEVIANIMLNWIAFYLNNFIITSTWLKVPNSETSVSIKDSARIDIDWMTSLFGPTTKVNWGIFISIVLVLIIAFILVKTTLGFELRAVGFNEHASEYAGINVKKSMFIAMAIAGSLSALAGAIQVMGVSHSITVLPLPEGYGFDGIAVALIANNNPIGVIFSGLLFGALKYGGTKMQSVGSPSEVVDIIIGSIIYFIAMTNVIRMIYMKLMKNRVKEEIVDD